MYYTHSFNEIRYIHQTAVRNFFNLGETQRFGFEFVGKQWAFDKILSLQESINFNYSNVLKGRDETAAFNNNAIGASEASQEGKQNPLCAHSQGKFTSKCASHKSRQAFSKYFL